MFYCWLVVVVGVLKVFILVFLGGCGGGNVGVVVVGGVVLV